MKNVISIILGLLIIQLAILPLSGCFKPKYSDKQLDGMLFYAEPEGGISFFQVDEKKSESLTEEKDYYPYLDAKSQTLYFIRLQQNPEKNNIVTYSAKSMRMNLTSGNIRAMAVIDSYKTTPSLPDQIFFINEGRQLFIQNDQRIQFYDTQTGKSIQENLPPYLAELNQYNEKEDNWYIRIRQSKHPSFYKTEVNLFPHDYFDAIVEFDENGIITPLLTIPKEKLYSEYIDGYSFSQASSLLAVGYSGNIQLLDETHQVIHTFPGKHPYFKKSMLSKSAMSQFPFYKIQAFVDFQSYYVFGSLHWAGRIRKGTLELQLFTDQELSLTSREPLDTSNLFEHISVMRLVKNPSLLIITSVKDTEKQASVNNIMALESIPDQLLLISLENEQWTSLMQFGEKIGLLLEWKNLDLEDQEELIVRYSASTFKCEGRFQSTGRSLVWTDVYRYHEDIRQYINDSALFPSIYKDLLLVLEPLQERALTAIRLKDPILCQDDLDKLSQLIQEAKSYANLS